MATSGYIRKTAAFGYVQLEWKEESQSVDTNSTLISYKLYVQRNTSEFSDSSTKAYSITINGTKVSSGAVALNGYGTKTVKTGTTRIYHNANGTKSFTYSFSQTIGLGYGTLTGSGTGTLDTIDRASKFTKAENGRLGTSQIITITPTVSTAKHKISYKCGNKSGYVAGSATSFTTATSFTFTPPLDLATENTTGASVQVTLYLYTYLSDGTLIGEVSKTLSMYIPASVAPSVSIYVREATAYSNKYGGYVKGYSKLYIELTETLAYGSAIVSRSTSVNGTKYASAAFTTDVLKTAGSQAITATVKDGRGSTGTASLNATVLDYKQPTIIKLTVRRCNEDGTANDMGAYCQATFSATVTPLNDINTAKYKLKYKKSIATSYTTVDFSDIENTYTVTDYAHIFPADEGNSYDVELDVTDDFKTEKRTTNLSTAKTLFHWGKKGIGVGKLDENANPFEREDYEGLLDIGFDTRFNKAVCGKVLGLDRLPRIPENADFNDYMETGCWAVYSNAAAATIANMPVAKAGRLEISAATGEGIRVTEYSYLRQKFVPYSLNFPTYERDVTRSANNIWTYGPWLRTGGQVVLWEGSLPMGESASGVKEYIELNDKISNQPNGIVITFSRGDGYDPYDNNFHHFFVPKSFIKDYIGYGHTYLLASSDFSVVGTKYLYINDQKITGNANNSIASTGTSGIKYTNYGFVLRRVTGV